MNLSVFEKCWCIDFAKQSYNLLILLDEYYIIQTDTYLCFYYLLLLYIIVIFSTGCLEILQNLYSFVFCESNFYIYSKLRFKKMKQNRSYNVRKKYFGIFIDINIHTKLLSNNRGFDVYHLKNVKYSESVTIYFYSKHWQV